MAKIFKFVPKNENNTKEYLRPCEVVKIDDDFMPFINMSMSAYVEKCDYDSIYFFNKAFSIFSKKYVRGLDFSLIGIVHFFHGNYDLSLKYLFNSISEIEHIRAPLSLIIYQIFYMKKDYKAMEDFVQFALKNNFVTSKDWFTLISPLEGRSIESVNPNSKLNLNKVKNEIVHAINIRNFDKACRLLDMAIVIDETDPYIWYLRNNIDEAFNGKLSTTFPEYAKLELLNTIDKALSDSEILNELQNRNDSSSLIRFVLEYVDRDKALNFFSKIFSCATNRMVNLAIDQMYTTGNDKKRLDLCFLLLSQGLVQKIAFRTSKALYTIILGDMRVIKRISSQFMIGVLYAVEYLIFYYDNMVIDLTIEIASILKGVNSQNLSLLFDAMLVKDLILYYYCKRRQIQIFDCLKNQEQNLITKLEMLNISFNQPQIIDNENIVFINKK